jgi:rSAM/selenodomain-associated transferase 1
VPDQRCVVLFTKPARPGEVKTRLIGDLTPGQAAALHEAFLADLVGRLSEGSFSLLVAWAASAEEPVPAEPGPGFRQRGGDLGERLHHGLERAAREHELVVAVGSDHPELPVERVEAAFELLAGGCDVVLGPAEDGGYYLIGLRRQSLDGRLFAGIDWSTDRVLAQTRLRCRSLGLEVGLLPPGADVDTPDDLRRLVRRLTGTRLDCPATRTLLQSWGRIEG